MKYIPYEMQDVGIAESKNLFRVISTFAGGGGSSTGYRLAGGNILAINEFVEEARNTYHANFPHTLIIPDDIKKLSGKDFLEPFDMKPGQLDILDGSPPCSPQIPISKSGWDDRPRSTAMLISWPTPSRSKTWNGFSGRMPLATYCMMTLASASSRLNPYVV